ncbi:MAG: hypothetical protein LAP40_17190 [Acidobacteriia bacterium]|nr:hypothetical protein [Terriglobia bacterium]
MSGYDGRLRVFIRGADNALWFAAQTSPGGSWTPFVSLGGVIISNPKAVLDPSGHIAVFAVGGDTAVWRRSETTADNYSDWISIGGSGTSDLAVVQTDMLHVSIPAAYVFMRGPDNALWYNQTNEASGPWGTSWTSLGGSLASAPGAGVNGNGQVTVFVRGSYDNAPWYRQATSPGASPTFNDWATLGGAMNGPASVVESGRYVMYRGMDNAAWSILDTTPLTGKVAPATWSDPASLGGYIISNPTMAPPPHFGPNDLEVLVVGGDTALWVTASPGSGSPFGPWQSLGGSLVGNPIAVRDADQTVDAFAVGSDGALWHIRQSTAGSWQ